MLSLFQRPEPQAGEQESQDIVKVGETGGPSAGAKWQKRLLPDLLGSIPRGKTSPHSPDQLDFVPKSPYSPYSPYSPACSSRSPSTGDASTPRSPLTRANADHSPYASSPAYSSGFSPVFSPLSSRSSSSADSAVTPVSPYIDSLDSRRTAYSSGSDETSQSHSPQQAHSNRFRGTYSSVIDSAPNSIPR
jgi:hypothetical protein